MAKTDRGFALVEVGVALPVLIIAVTGVLTAIYLCIAQAWLNDASEEAALCVAEKVSLLECKAELRKKTSWALPIGEFTRLSIEKSETRIVVKYAFQAVQVILENEIYLRLPVSKRAVGR